jgi:anthranilate phosphoribosyltransferase
MGPTHAEVRDGAVTEWTIRPEDYGADHRVGAGWGGPADNARTITEVLAEVTPRPRRVVLTRRALYVAPEVARTQSASRPRPGAPNGAGAAALERIRRAYMNR